MKMSDFTNFADFNPYAPIYNDIKSGIDEIRARNAGTIEAKEQSKEDYLAGEHGLVDEFVNQGIANFKNNVGNIFTAGKTGLAVAEDIVEVPVNTAIASAQEAKTATMEDIGIRIEECSGEINDRNGYVEMESERSRYAYLNGEHGLGQEIINQTWGGVKRDIENAGTVLRTDHSIIKDLLEAPGRYLRNFASKLFGF
jgi:hypothetical protein